MTWVGWLYQDERGQFFVAPQERPADLLPIREVGLPRCGQHGCVKSECAEQYHAPDRDWR